MKYEIIKGYGGGKFRKICGVKRATFEKMIEILAVAQAKKLPKGGGKPKLCR